MLGVRLHRGAPLISAPLSGPNVPFSQASSQHFNHRRDPRNFAFTGFVGAMSKDHVLALTAEQCRRLALRVRTDAARQQLLKTADEFEAKAERERETAPVREAAN